MTVSRDDVISAYRLLLGREPESEDAIQSHMQYPTVDALRGHFIRSAEFYRIERNERFIAAPRGWWTSPLFIVTVVIPTAIAVVYFGLIASDVYSSESRFVVRSSEGAAPSSALGTMFKGFAVGRTQDDSYSVVDFVASRDALAVLDRESRLRDAVSSTKVDFFDRFPGFDRDRSFEALHYYYAHKIVSVQQDPSSGIVTLVTRAYTPGDALAFNRELLQASEALVNRINRRAEDDAIGYAASEVRAAQEAETGAALALARFRNDKGLLDPEKEASIPLQQVGKLQDELVTVESQIKQLERIAQGNPQLPVLRQQRTLLEQTIAQTTERVAGRGKDTLASKTADYTRLALQKDFADKMLAGAMLTLAQAREEAQRKRLYLERIVEPQAQDSAREPRRLRSMLTVMVLGLVSWGVLAMLAAGIKEHME